MLRVLCTLLLSTAALPAQVVVVEAPVRGQLYARDLATNQANVPVIGVVRTPGMSRMHLLVARGGVAWSSATVDLAYAGGEAPFSFSAPIDAGWHDYTFELRLEGGGSNRSLGKIRGVVCGDAFLVNGQSNAVASDYHAEGLGNTSQSRWIRSYGSSTFYASQVTLDTEWHLADGNGQYAAGAVGAWALRAAELLVNRYQVPIALLNGAVGGTTLFQHQRNDADPEDLNTIYGRLLYRSRLSGLRDKARAMLWHQGESDGGTAPAAFTAAYGALRDDWLA
ncbi:MAG TPA: sialate O-acetylesterase, partial [Planctomycetota bacterium]